MFETTVHANKNSQHKMLPLVITDIRPLTRDELTASRVPAGPGENPREIELWYQSQGR